MPACNNLEKQNKIMKYDKYLNFVRPARRQTYYLCLLIYINPFKTEANQCANQWTGFYMITASVLKGLSTCLCVTAIFVLYSANVRRNM